MPTAFITGAGRGLGLEFARQYLADDWRVIGACRKPDAAPDLAGLGGDLHVVAMAVDDDAAIAATAAELRGETIDVLINNAGIFGPREASLGSLDTESWLEAFRINAIAPIKVAEAFVEHVAGSEQRKIVSISSVMASIGLLEKSNAYIYRSSKTALNMAHKCLAIELAARGVTAAVFHPGWVRTEMGGSEADIDAAESVAGMREVTAGLTPDRTGRFWNYDGSEIPW